MLAVLEIARSQKVTVTRTKLAKLLYFADLEAVRDGETRPTDIVWKWLQHGPYEYDLMHAENTLVDIQVIERSQVPTGGVTSVQLKLLRSEGPRPDLAALDILSAQVERYGHLAASSLKDLAYQTEPMLAAQATGKRGVILDLSLARRRSADMSAAVKRFKAARVWMQDQEDGPEVEEGMKQLLEETSEGRGRATRHILGD